MIQFELCMMAYTDQVQTDSAEHAILAIEMKEIANSHATTKKYAARRTILTSWALNAVGPFPLQAAVHKRPRHGLTYQGPCLMGRLLGLPGPPTKNFCPSFHDSPRRRRPQTWTVQILIMQASRAMRKWLRIRLILMSDALFLVETSVPSWPLDQAEAIQPLMSFTVISRRGSM